MSKINMAKLTTNKINMTKVINIFIFDGKTNYEKINFG
jgi:hypothetical protein